MTITAESDLTLFTNMKSIMSLVDKLRDFKLDSYMSLPRITVLGEQSAGKSSILESIVGLNFLPRGSGVVTRRPLELRLRRVNTPVPTFVFTRDFPNKKITNPEEVCKTIESLTDKVAGIDKFISADPIVLEVSSASVPDLTLVDLPGITRIPIGKQPQNIEEITKNLIRFYCESPDSLILCIIPANIDITTSDALLFARQLDPVGARTLGVLTKIDLMDEGVDCKKVLMNEEIKLTHGFVGIKGRNQREVNEKKTVKEAIQTELNYFCRHPVYSTLPSDILGTSSLVNRTSKILFEMIQTALPRIQREIGERKKKARDTLDALGEDFPDTDEKKMEMVFKLVRSFKESYDQDISGKYFFENTQNIRSKAQRKKTETVTFQLNQQFNELYHDFAAPDFQVTREYTNDYIQNAMDTYQGDSMPGFQSFDSFLFLITPKLRTLKSPIYEVLEESKMILENKGNELLEELLKKYPKLLNEIRDTFLRVLNTTKMNTQKILDNIVRCEENYLFTNNPEILQGAVIKRNVKATAVNLMVAELRFRIDAYFNITVKNIRNTVPKVVGQFLLKKLRDNLEVEILNSLAKKNYCLDGIVESDATTEHRKSIKQELNSLTAAENLLINEFGMTFDFGKNTDLPSSARRIDTTEISTELMEDIDKMNDDFLNFNIGLLKLTGETPKMNPIIIKEKPLPGRNEGTTQQRPNVGRDESNNQTKPSQQTNQQPSPANGQQAFRLGGGTSEKKQAPEPQPRQEVPIGNKTQPVSSTQPSNLTQNTNYQQPQQTQAQQRPNPQIQQPTQNYQQQPQQQPQQQQPQQPQQQQPVTRPSQNQFDINLFSQPSNIQTNQQRNPNPTKPTTGDASQNAFLNFGNNRDKSPFKVPGQSSQPQQPQPQQTPSQQKPTPVFLQKPEETKQTTKPTGGKFNNLFG